MGQEGTLVDIQCPQCKSDKLTKGEVKRKEVVKFGALFGITIIVLGLLLMVLAMLLQWDASLKASINTVKIGGTGILIFPIIFWFVMRNHVAYQCTNCQHKWYKK